MIGYFPWWRAADIPSGTYHDETRKIFDREHLRADKTPRNAQTRDRTVPILVRPDGDRFVLIHGLHRLEACKALGEETIYGYLTQAPKH